MKVIFFATLVLLISCDRPDCTNSNPVFAQFPPHSGEYRNELAKQLASRDQNDLRYWFESYEVKDGKEYINVYIQGGGLCSKGFVLVDGWEGLEGIRKTKGMGYRGAELRGFEMDIREDSSRAEFVFKHVASIID